MIGGPRRVLEFSPGQCGRDLVVPVLRVRLSESFVTIRNHDGPCRRAEAAASSLVASFPHNVTVEWPPQPGPSPAPQRNPNIHNRDAHRHDPPCRARRRPRARHALPASCLPCAQRPGPAVREAEGRAGATRETCTPRRHGGAPRRHGASADSPPAPLPHAHPHKRARMHKRSSVGSARAARSEMPQQPP